MPEVAESEEVPGRVAVAILLEEEGMVQEGVTAKAVAKAKADLVAAAVATRAKRPNPEDQPFP